MQAATPAMPGEPGMKQNRVFILSSLSVGHGLSHMFDQGFPLLVTEIAKAMGLSTFHTATLFAVRQGGSSATSLGGGPLIDYPEILLGPHPDGVYAGPRHHLRRHRGRANFCAGCGGGAVPVYPRFVMAPALGGGHFPAFSRPSRVRHIHARVRLQPGQRQRAGDCGGAAGRWGCSLSGGVPPHLAARFLHLRRAGFDHGGVRVVVPARRGPG